MILTKNYFKFFVWVSTGGHVLIFLFLWLSSSSLFYSKPVLIKEAIRVDMVGLPDLVQKPQKTSPPPQPAPKKAPPKPVKKPKPKPKKEPVKKEPVKDLEQIKKSQNQAIQNMMGASSSQTPPEKPTYKGEQVSEGDSQTGDLDTVLMYGYFTRVRTHIKMFWNLPRFLADKNYKATVVIEVNPEGNIMRIRLEKSSGNESFDQIVIETIRMASPLPTPPRELHSVLRQGVGFNFPD